MAEASAPKPLELSRYCVPFTPFKAKLEDASICLVSTAAVRHKDDRPFNTDGDTSWRVIASDAEAKDLTYDDTHYDHACVDRDLNCVFPIDRVRELREYYRGEYIVLLHDGTKLKLSRGRRAHLEQLLGQSF